MYKYSIRYYDLIMFAEMHNFSDAEIFNVLDISEKPPTVVPSRKALRIRAIKESFKALIDAFGDNSDFKFLQDHIEYYAASSNVSMANFMKFWILLEKYSKLNFASSVLKSHIKLLSEENRNNPVLQHINFLRSILR